MKVMITVDMEHDCPPYFETYRGVEQGTPKLLNLFKEEGIPATFFTTGDVARKYPQTAQAIVDRGHELGCHGDTHKKFTDMSPEEAEQEIIDSSATLRKFYPVVSFRAPNLMFPNEYLIFLEKADYLLDSSQAKYKRAYYKKNQIFTKLHRIPASVTSSVLRLPKKIRFAWFNRIKDPVVLFVHPWEFVDFTQEKLRLDCRFKTGDIAVDCLRENIQFFKKKGAEFLAMKETMNGLVSN